MHTRLCFCTSSATMLSWGEASFSEKLQAWAMVSMVKLSGKLVKASWVLSMPRTMVCGQSVQTNKDFRINAPDCPKQRFCFRIAISMGVWAKNQSSARFLLNFLSWVHMWLKNLFLQDAQAMVGIWTCVLKANQSMTSCKNAKDRCIIRAQTTIVQSNLPRDKNVQCGCPIFVISLPLLVWDRYAFESLRL